VLRSDGTATYIGKRFVERVGEFDGRFNPYYFERLAQFIESQGYFNLQDKYEEQMTDQNTVITSAVRRNKRKTIVNYGGEAPVKLWGIEMAIDGVLTQIRWERRASRSPKNDRGCF
jgi:hypothetical protein